MMMTSKPWWRSRTIWLNAIAGLLAFVEVNFHLLQGELSPKAYLIYGGIVAFANVALRLVTNTGVHVAPPLGGDRDA
jgi:hypothetical protein